MLAKSHVFVSPCFFPHWLTFLAQAKLVEVYSTAEQDFVVERIRHSVDYTTTNTYWLGGMLGLEGRWQWLSGEPMSFTGKANQGFDQGPRGMPGGGGCKWVQY